MDDQIWYTRFVCIESQLELANVKIQELEKLVDELQTKLANLE